MFQRILVPLDGSDFAELALPLAASIAHRAGATLDLVRGHVVYALKTPASHWAAFDPTMEAEYKQEEKLYLDSTARLLSTESNVRVCTNLVAGFEAEGILEHIGSTHPDLIVITTHGRALLADSSWGASPTTSSARAALPCC
jgi:nucleotide-binding universal stress UspA family protein